MSESSSQPACGPNAQNSQAREDSGASGHHSLKPGADNQRSGMGEAEPVKGPERQSLIVKLKTLPSHKGPSQSFGIRINYLLNSDKEAPQMSSEACQASDAHTHTQLSAPLNPAQQLMHSRASRTASPYLQGRSPNLSHAPPSVKAPSISGSGPLLSDDQSVGQRLIAQSSLNAAARPVRGQKRNIVDLTSDSDTDGRKSKRSFRKDGGILKGTTRIDVGKLKLPADRFGPQRSMAAHSGSSAQNPGRVDRDVLIVMSEQAVNRQLDPATTVAPTIPDAWRNLTAYPNLQEDMQVRSWQTAPIETLTVEILAVYFRHFAMGIAYLWSTEHISPAIYVPLYMASMLATPYIDTGRLPAAMTFGPWTGAATQRLVQQGYILFDTLALIEADFARLIVAPELRGTRFTATLTTVFNSMYTLINSAKTEINVTRTARESIVGAWKGQVHRLNNELAKANNTQAAMDAEMARLREKDAELERENARANWLNYQLAMTNIVQEGQQAELAELREERAEIVREIVRLKAPKKDE